MADIPEISIVVPVYNMEKYLRACLDSIVVQTFVDWECILVDDGSSDNSGAICDEYASRDSRFRVIHRVNGGLSAARNSGLAVCRGRYIGFVDSDDYIHSCLLQRFHELMEEYDADVVQVSYEMVYITYTKPRRLVDSIVTLEGSRCIELLFKTQMPNYVWNKLFRREVIDVDFPEGKTFEDVYVMTMWTKNIGKMVIAPDVLCSYRQRKSSISRVLSLHYQDYLDAIMLRAHRFRDGDSEVVSKNKVNLYLWKCVINAAKDIARHVNDTKLRTATVLDMSELTKTFAAPEIKELGMKQWFRAVLLRKKPTAFMRIIRISYVFYHKNHHQQDNLFD